MNRRLALLSRGSARCETFETLDTIAVDRSIEIGKIPRRHIRRESKLRAVLVRASREMEFR